VRWNQPPDQLPEAWSNVVPHLTTPLDPPLPATREPVDQSDSPGSLGLAISGAVRDVATRSDSHYSLGSVLNHVLLHQTVIGQGAKTQLELAGERLPNVVIGCCGGGSNFGGISLPFVPDAGARLLAAAPTACATFTTGTFEYDFGDTAGIRCSRLRYPSPGRRVLFLLPRLPMRSGPPSTRRSPQRRPVKKGSSSATPGTACSTSAPTTITCTGI